MKSDDKFDRGKIIGVNYSDVSIKIFCVDTGAVVMTGLENVYDLPDHLLKKTPFQVHTIIQLKLSLNIALIVKQIQRSF